MYIVNARRALSRNALTFFCTPFPWDYGGLVNNYHLGHSALQLSPRVLRVLLSVIAICYVQISFFNCHLSIPTSRSVSPSHFLALKELVYSRNRDFDHLDHHVLQKNMLSKEILR